MDFAAPRHTCRPTTRHHLDLHPPPPPRRRRPYQHDAFTLKQNRADLEGVEHDVYLTIYYTPFRNGNTILGIHAHFMDVLNEKKAFFNICFYYNPLDFVQGYNESKY